MHDDKPATGIRLATTVGGVLAVIGAVWIIVLAFQPTTVTSRADRSEVLASRGATRELPLSLDGRLLLESDLGTAASEFSAVAFNESAEVIVIADDEGTLFEFTLDADDGPARLLRSIEVQIGSGDVEGLAWISGSTYALLDEADGSIHIIDLADGVRSIDEAHVERVVSTGITGASGSGLEGVALVGGASAGGDGVAFVVVEERPPTLHGIAGDGTIVWSLLLDVGISDVSDVWLSDQGVYSVLSDESRVIVDLWIDPNGAVEVVGRLDLTFETGRFEQPEGLARSQDGTRLFVVGEAPAPGRYSFGSFRFG